VFYLFVSIGIKSRLCNYVRVEGGSGELYADGQTPVGKPGER
jgi:hypothetical protein